ncbi:hypothetical protein H1W00_09485 [Aeromicrobium sp. Marseille-Q0843]|uniref:Uncharacterized protein n=1 Tax=Aeromicrobium phoceense TaxID=2754045 RepID=A0A838XNZ9_9ACTN|nr:hypothetical protein [Aeromicrobium phoceense]MBA4608703.1 hypothetical protein [Aeromicrobium phoceense]
MSDPRTTKPLAVETGRHALYFWSAQLTANDVPVIDMFLPPGRETDVILGIDGGSVDAGRRLARYLEGKPEHIRALIPTAATSAGTIAALGADEIQLSEVGCLSPVDPSLSATLPNGVSYDVAAEDVRRLREAECTWFPGSEAAVQALFQRLNPIVLTQLYRSEAEVVGAVESLLSRGRHLLPSAEASKVANELVNAFGSHLHAIDRREAREIGLDVLNMSVEVEAICKTIVAPEVVSSSESEGVDRGRVLARIVGVDGPLVEKVVLPDGALAWVTPNASGSST